MNVLVIGGNGFIGSHLVDHLLSAGDNVSVFDRQPECYRKPLQNVTYHIQDFGNRMSLYNALNNIDVVYHLVSTTIPKTSNDDPIFDVSSNVIETLYLLECCVEKKISKIIFLSSGGTVYGVPDSLPVKEDSSTNPDCSYGITKLTIEKYLQLFYSLYGLDYVIIRPSNPYGPRQNFNGIQGVISVLLGKIAMHGTLEIWGNGDVIRDYVYVKDIVDGIYKAATAKTVSRTFNMGSGIGCSLNDIIRTIKTELQIEFNVQYLPARPFDVPRIYLDCERAKRELSWQSETTMSEGIKRTWEFVKSMCDV